MNEQEKREKVIKGLECCFQSDAQCGMCPYDDALQNCSDNLKADALALLKAQEPVMAINELVNRNGVVRTGHCGQCSHWLFRCYHYCPECGRAVKWGS